MMNNERLVITCMNNKILYLNMTNIKGIVLLDEACDSPVYINWDEHVSCGEIPLVIYEALEDYIVLDCTTIYYGDGEIRFVKIDFDYDSENISTEIFLNVKNISMMELLLMRSQKAKRKNFFNIIIII